MSVKRIPSTTPCSKAYSRRIFGALLAYALGIEREPYLILGACNPQLAHRALEADPSVGALLPCNVVLRAEDDRTRVEILNPSAALAIAGAHDDLSAVADEARDRLLLVVAALEAAR